VYRFSTRGANVYFVRSGSSSTLIDTGWRNSGPAIYGAASSLFGPGTPPASILLTHAHPDHAGAAAELAHRWDVPVHVHAADLPLLSSDLDAMARGLDPIGRFFLALMLLLPQRTRERMQSPDLQRVARALPGADAAVPGLADWQCVPTPGHSPGHVVFFRESDRVLIAGDAVFTVPLWGLVPGLQRLSRPPRLASWNWRMTMESMGVLASLEPAVLACGHGAPMAGAGLAGELRAFSDRCSDPARRKSAAWHDTAVHRGR
jgi:glyoxylase-like metal-dependent hydrolase (beta-lactamase superfamily II)